MPQQLRLLDDRPSTLAVDGHVVMRESRRARRLFLQLVPPHTLELVVPVGTRARDVQAFLAEHAEWIESARRHVTSRYAGDRRLLPTRIRLKSVGREFVVHYRHARNVQPRAHTEPGRLVIETAYADHRDARELLRAWLLAEAREHLKPWLMSEAARTGRAPKKVQVRLQRTRWGSCSSQGNISLNASALFLARPVARYLMVHELCHLYSLNHSRRFWNHVERYEPDYRRLDRELANAWTEVPLWVVAA